MVVEGAEGDAIRRSVRAACGPEDDVMVVKIAPRRAARDRAEVAIALDHGIGMRPSPLAEGPGPENVIEQRREDLPVGGLATELGPELRPEGFARGAEEPRDVPRDAPREALGCLRVDLGRTLLPLRLRQGILRALGVILATLPPQVVAGAQQKCALDVRLEAPHRHTLGPGDPAGTPFAGEVE
jgi:hypothetical protein